MGACLALAAALLGPAAWAQEAELKRQGDRYDYRFVDAGGRSRTLSFSLRAAEVERSERLLLRFNAQDLAGLVRRRVLPYVREQYGPALDIEVEVTKLGYRYAWSGPPELPWEPLREDVRQVGDAVRAGYYRERFLRVMPAGGVFPEGGTVPDYPRLVALFAPVLEPVVSALRQATTGMDERQAASFLNAWLQAIPYRELKERDPREGYGVLPPPSFLSDHAGDCDTKALCCATLLTRLVPQLGVALVLVSGHAFMAVDLPAPQRQRNDALVAVGAARWVAFEPVGPGRYDLGRLSDRSREAVQAGRLAVLPIPPGEVEEEQGPQGQAVLRPAFGMDLRRGKDGWRTQVYVGPDLAPREIAFQLTPAATLPLLGFDFDNHLTELLPRLTERMRSEVTTRFPEVDRVDVVRTGAGWSYTVVPDQAGQRRRLQGLVDDANARGEAYNRLVKEQNEAARAYNAETDAQERRRLRTRHDDLVARVQGARSRYEEAVAAARRAQDDGGFAKAIEDARQEARRVADEGEAQYYREHHVRQAGTALVLDFPRIAEAYRARLKPLAAALRAHAPAADPRRGAEEVLAFFASIPFVGMDPSFRRQGPLIQDRSLGLLFDEHRGDTLAKALGAAAVLRELYPDRSVIIMEREQRGHLGLELEARVGDEALAHEGRRYVVLDPGGPIHFEPGRRRSFFAGYEQGPSRVGVVE